MEDFANILHRDYGLKPGGKSAPMHQRAGSASGSSTSRSGSDVFGSPAPASVRSSSSGALYDDVFGGPPTGVSSSSNDFGDLLGGFKPSASRPPQPSQSNSSFADDLLGGYSAASKPQQASTSSLDDIFSGGLGQTLSSSHNSFSANNQADDPFSSFGMPKPEPKVTQSQALFDDEWNFGASKSKPAPKGASTLHASIDGDLLGGFSTSGSRSTPFRSPPSSPPRAAKNSEPVFDEFLPGFGGAGDQGKKTAVVPDADAMRGIPIISTNDDDVFSSIPSSTSVTAPDPLQFIPKSDASRGIPPLDADEMRGIPPLSSSPIVDDDPFSSAAEVDPFANIIKDSTPTAAASFADPLDPFNMPPASVLSSNGATEGSSSAQFSNGSRSYDPFDGFPQPSTSKEKEESAPSLSGSGSDGRESSQGSGTWDDRPSRRGFGKVPFNVDPNEAPEVASPTYPSGRTEMESNGFDDEPKFNEASEERSYSSRRDTDKVPIDIFEEQWLTVDDLKLMTAPSGTRPPSRAPPRPGRSSRSSTDSLRNSVGERSWGRSDELPAYRASSRPNGADAALKEDELARERAAALVQKEREAAVRERAVRQRERAERQRERERQMDRQREQETARNAEAAKAVDEGAERARKAAERAVKEAQHRMEKAAAERAIAEARERAERAARDRARENAREEQREKEQKEREEREKREQEERARRAKAREERERERDRREREERERREREDREKERERDRERDRRRERERGAAEQPRPTGASSSRATSEPRQRPSTNQPAASASGGDVRRPSSGNPVYSSTGSSPAPTPAPRNPQPSVKAVDDWTTLLTQTAPTGDEFQDIPGETPERRKLRMERHQKTIERAQQALKEKNDRDKAMANEQAERSRNSVNLDAEIRRWAMGKEGNLRALLSSLHLVLWPESNWKPVSLTDLITGVSVKKAHQRAMLCVHPDKVQQKGATVQQKYVAEKVFDLLREAFAKFNSTELY